VNIDFSRGFAAKRCQCVSNAEPPELYPVFIISHIAISGELNSRSFVWIPNCISTVSYGIDGRKEKVGEDEHYRTTFSFIR
jgi:hypothetical protein